MPCWCENKLVSLFLCNLEARTESCKGVPPQGMYPQEIIKDVNKIQLNERAQESFLRAERCEGTRAVCYLNLWSRLRFKDMQRHSLDTLQGNSRRQMSREFAFGKQASLYVNGRVLWTDRKV